MDFGTLEFLKVALVGIVVAAVLYWALDLLCEESDR